MYHLDLFSGIGGFSLACDWAGIETIGFVEIDKFCQKVLRKHWPNVPIVEDIRDVERIKEIVAHTTGRRLQECELRGEAARNACEGGEAIKEIVANATELHKYARNHKRAESQSQVPESRDGDCEGHLSRGGDRGNGDFPTILVTAGFPCQPFSVAGKRGGDTDDRYLWPETLAVIEAVKPAWVLLENVAGIIPMALDTVLSDLEGAGYAWETCLLPACSKNAPHRRDRIWIVANAISRGCWTNGQRPSVGGISGRQQDDSVPPTQSGTGDGEAVAFPQGGQSWQSPEPEGWEDSGRGSPEVLVADTVQQGGHGRGRPGGTRRRSMGEGEAQGNGWRGEPKGDVLWATEPDVGRVAHGIPSRVDRLKCLGNAIVPQVAYEIIRVIKEIDANAP